MDCTRVNAYLKVACTALDFELGEVWCYRKQESNSTNSDDEDVDSLSRAMRFVQLYTSPEYDIQQGKLLRPKSIPDPSDIHEHRFSPVLCDAVRSGKRLVWASTEEGSGLLGRSDLPLRTAVGVPVCCIGFDLCILVLFGTKRTESHASITDLLMSIAQAAGGHMSGALPASISSPITTCLEPAEALASSSSGGGRGGDDGLHHALREANKISDSSTGHSRNLVSRRIVHKLTTSTPNEIKVRIIAVNRPDAFQEIVVPGTRRSAVEAGSKSSVVPNRSLSPFSPSRTFAELFPYGYMDSFPLDPALLTTTTFGGNITPTLPSQPPPPPPAMASSATGETDLLAFVTVPADSPLVPVANGDSPPLPLASETPFSACQTTVAMDRAAVPVSSDPGASAQHESLATGSVDPAAGLTEDPFVWDHPVGFDDDLSDFDLDGSWDLLGDASSNDLDATLHGGMRIDKAMASDQNLDTTLHGGSRNTGFTSGGTAVSAQRGQWALEGAENMVPRPVLSVVDSAQRNSSLLRGRDDAASVLSSSAAAAKGTVTATGSGGASNSMRLHAMLTGATFRRQRFEEMMRGFLDMTIFEAADCWIAQAGGATEGLQAPGTFLKYGFSVIKNPALHPWAVYSADMTFAPKMGLPGRVLATGCPVWERSLHRKPPHEYPRTPGAKALGIATAFGVPVRDLGMDRPGVICFYSTASMEHSELIVGFLQKIVRLLDSGELDTSALPPLTGGPSRRQVQPAPVQGSPSEAPASVADGPKNRAVVAPASRILPNEAFFYSTEQRPGPPPPLVTPKVEFHPSSQGGLVGRVQPQPDQAMPKDLHLDALGQVETLPASPNLGLDLAKSQNFFASDVGLDLSSKDLDALTHDAKRPRHEALGDTTKPSSELLAAVAVAAGVTPPFALPVSLDLLGNPGPSMSNTAPPSAKICRMVDCNQPASKRSPYCASHMGARQCQHPGCNKCAQGSTKYCIAHGGGRRCTHPGCTRGARDKFFCAAHGGGKRCSMPNCNKSAVGGSSLCTAHGGGRRCQYEGCSKSAQSSTSFCVRHGGGRKCSVDGCEKVARGRTAHCAAHGGGVRCKFEGCNKAAVGRQQLCRVHSGTSVPKRRQSKAAAAAAAATAAAAAEDVRSGVSSTEENTLNVTFSASSATSIGMPGILNPILGPGSEVATSGDARNAVHMAHLAPGGALSSQWGEGGSDPTPVAPSSRA